MIPTIQQKIRKNNGGRLKFISLFIVYCATGISFLYFFPVDPFLQPFLKAMAAIVGKSLEIFGFPVVILAQKIRFPGTFGVEITLECSAIPHLIVLLSAILAFPTSKSSRLIGILSAIIGIYLTNIFRIFMLFLTGVYAREYFNFAHVYVWGIISISFILLLWLLWLRLSALPQQKPIYGRMTGKV